MRGSTLFAALATFALAAPAALAAQNAHTPANATAKCNDGTYSASKSHQGACAKHGGIAQWLTTSNTSTVATAPAGATARCDDGTYTKSRGQGACSSHGGVATWLTDIPDTTVTAPSSRQPAAENDRAPTTAQPAPADNNRVPPQSYDTSAAVATATAVCRDGSYSHSTHRSGTCSRHGGVAEWLHRPGGR